MNTRNRSTDVALDLLDAVLNSISDPILILQNKRDIITVNEAAEFLFSVTKLPARVEDVLPSELLPIIQDNLSLPEWQPNEERTYIPRLHALTSATSLTPYQILTLRDVSQFKKLSRNQYEFMRLVSHDLRSPLTSMQGFASMLGLGLVGDLNEKQSHFVDKILSGIAQITALVENIQDAGRFDPETGFYEIMRAPCDMTELVSKVVKTHLIPAEKQELTITLQIADDIPIINADTIMLERALTNLIDNAIKYTPNGGRITVRLHVQDQEIRIEVADTGFGIPPEDQQRLFQRHVRLARPEHKRIKGSGLGLFIVRSVALHHGGDASVNSVEGEGSTFVIRLPLGGANQIFSA